jgi:fermentation-respiration switch protein FrsA (DUF1100 family)
MMAMNARWLLCIAVVLVGCTDESLNPAPYIGSGNGTVPADDPVQKPPGEPEAIIIDAWQVVPTSAASDPVGSAISDGSFVMPGPGYLGLNWAAHVPGENGELIDSNTDYIYAVATVKVPDGHRVFARGDTVSTFYTNNVARQPGNFYHSRKMRVPLGSRDGDNLIVVRALGRRNTPEVELWSTAGEVVMNTADVTLPQFVVGELGERHAGIATLVTSDEAPIDVHARVVEGDYFEATDVTYASLQPQAVTQLSFLLRPKSPLLEADITIPVKVRISSPSLDWDYDAIIDVPTVATGARYRMTRRSAVDGSTQYYAVLPPTDPESQLDYGLILSLHGAGVEASGQAAAYSNKDWAYLIAATNRRPYGFDWEEWGRLDAIEALDHATLTLPIDPLRVHLTGHSMGGHGSWHNGVHFADRFGVIAPSAGWISFEQYGGPAHPDGVIGRARAASQTLDFVGNIAQRSVFIIHGSADDNVPVSHAVQMFNTLGPIVSELQFHNEPGARHWWDLDPDEAGADCVDWEPMIDVMEARLRDPLPLEFNWTSPGAWVNDQHSFVTLLSSDTPMENAVIDSVLNGDQVVLTTTNVEAILLDGAILADTGITNVDVDGVNYLTGSNIAVGTPKGKRAGQSGPLNQVFHKPFCFVWPDAATPARNVASFMTSWWSLIGNGQACGVPLSRVSVLGNAYNRVYIGVRSDQLPQAMPEMMEAPVSWSEEGIIIAGQTITAAAIAFVYPDGDHLAAFIYATPGSEHLLYRYVPFSSRAGMPDYIVWEEDGLVGSGFFDNAWQYSSALSEGL